jgi:hypothetical protein
MIPQHQWVNKLMGFNFSIEYKPKATNTVADALSHREEEEAGELVALAVPTFKMFDDLHAKADEVSDLQHLKKEVLAGERGDKWRVVDDLITVAGKVYVSAASPLLPAILAVVHDMGHEGTEKTLNCLRRDFFVPGRDMWFKSTFVRARSVRGARLSTYTLSACYNRSSCRVLFGRMCPWTSWRAFRA